LGVSYLPHSKGQLKLLKRALLIIRTPRLARGWFMEGDALLPLHEVRRDERG